MQMPETDKRKIVCLFEYRICEIARLWASDCAVIRLNTNSKCYDISYMCLNRSLSLCASSIFHFLFFYFLSVVMRLICTWGANDGDYVTHCQ